jgi:hypothetical protein
MDFPAQTAPDGSILRLIPYAPSHLPLVAKGDLEQAWELAQHVKTPAPKQLFRFTRPHNQPPLDLVLADPDAAAWAAAVDGTIGLATPHGLSVCLRLLALIALMAQAAWARDWFALSRGGANIKPALLHAAALSPLTESGNFDETALRALLPPASA